MNIQTLGLCLEITSPASADGEGWARVAVSVEVPGFTGSTLAWLQVADLHRFSAELVDMDINLGQPSQARLCSVEPDLDLSLNMNSSGQIEGTLYLESQRIGDIPTFLSCGFELDQSFLPRLIKQVGQLISQLQGGVEGTGGV